ncbi:MAG: DnaJ domain-containing protein [Acidobacteriia bacterium]|nr:DnaJ domain-containing protein [Terriglobia bacterium]
MKPTKRQYLREPVDFVVTAYWEGAGGQACSSRLHARDVSQVGMRLDGGSPIDSGTSVYMDVPRYGSPVEAVVRYCVPGPTGYRMGVQFSSATKEPAQAFAENLDYYEVLQLSPKADMETVHRVYRIMAARFHPDNPDSGNQEKFLQMSAAYHVLSDPELRAQYDAMRGPERQRPLPLFRAQAFVDEKEGEVNRRLGMLCLLYAQRRRNPDHPAISLLELEELMSIPREYLEFTLWYLKQKHYIETTQGSDFSLTATGVDFVEEHTPANSMLQRLLQSVGSSYRQEPEASAAFVQ